MKNVSTNTSFEVERTPLALLGTATLIQQPRETLEAATNTSITVDEQEEAPVGQRKRLEGALMTNELLQAINASLHQELQSKDSRLDSMGQRLLDIIKRFQAVEPEPEAMQYKKLYHQSVEHCAVLQSQLEGFRALSEKMQRIEQLKTVVLACLDENKALFQQKYSDLHSEKQAWRRKLEASNARQAKLDKECEWFRVSCRVLVAEKRELAAKLSDSQSIAKTVQTLQGERIRELESSNAFQKTEIARQIKKMQKFTHCLQCSQQEYQEYAEFSEAERDSLLESNTELESQVAALQDNLKEKETALDAAEALMKSAEVCTQEERSQVRDLILAQSSEVGQLRCCIKEACILIRTIKEVPQAEDNQCKAGSLDQLESAELIRRLSGELQALVALLRDGRLPRAHIMEERRSEHFTAPVEPSLGTGSCQECQRLQEALDTSLTALNDRGCARYGDLLRENFSLQQQVQQLSKELSQVASLRDGRLPGAHSTERRSEHFTAPVEPSLGTGSCQECQRLQEALDTSLTALNDRGCARYGDLLRENFSLQQQMQQLSKKLSQGETDFQKLTSYIQSYQAKSTEKIDTLKKNLSKADTEVAELDILIDQIREVLHANIIHVKKCTPLLGLLRTLDGCEAPLEY